MAEGVGMGTSEGSDDHPPPLFFFWGGGGGVNFRHFLYTELG